MSKSFSSSFHKLTAFLLVLIFSHNFSVLAQVRKSNNTQVAAAAQPKAAPKCSGAWTRVPTAIWSVKDNAQSKSIHTDLTGTKDFSDFVSTEDSMNDRIVDFFQNL